MQTETDLPDVDPVHEAAVKGLQPIAFLVGRWAGEGSTHGVAVRGALDVRPALGATFLEAHEALFLIDGTLDYEDRVFYHFDPSEQQLRALHLLAPGHTATARIEHLPEADGGGILWDSGPLLPRVLWRPFGPDRLLCAVFLPGEAEPSTVLRYHRALEPMPDTRPPPT